MKFLRCPGCHRRGVYLAGGAPGEDHYACRYSQYQCEWWVYTDPDTNDDWIEIVALQKLNPDVWIVDLPPADAELT